MSSREIIHRHVTDFNGTVKTIVNNLYAKNKNFELEKLQTAVNALIRNTPLFMIQNSEVLWNLHKDIYAIRRDDGSYNWDIARSIPIPADAEPSLVSMFRNMFESSSEEERIEMYELLLELLVSIAHYRMHTSK